MNKKIQNRNQEPAKNRIGTGNQPQAKTRTSLKLKPEPAPKPSFYRVSFWVVKFCSLAKKNSENEKRKFFCFQELF
jgi:hypothetical protein